MPIVIKKKVSLDFLGEDYKDAYLVFRSLPLKDYEELSHKIDEAQQNEVASKFILNVLKEYFVRGSFPDMETVTKEDLDGLDIDTVLKCFSVFTGQEINREAGSEVPQVADLKVESKSQSSMEPEPPSN